MKPFLILFLLLFSSIKIYATIQQSDILYIKGEKYYILNKLLHHKILSKYVDENHLNYEINSSLWRGYIAEYEIVNTLFQTKDIVIPITSNEKTDIRLRDCDTNIFGILQPIFINTLLIVSKDNISMSCLGKDLSTIKIIEIQNNKVVKNIEMNSCQDYIQFRTEQFQKYKLTDYYRKDHYYSLLTIQNSREKYPYGENIPIEEEVEALIINTMFQADNFTTIL